MRFASALFVAMAVAGSVAAQEQKASPQEKHSSPKSIYLTWEKGAKAPLGSPEQAVLAECFTQEAVTKNRDLAQWEVTQYIVKNNFEFAEEKTKGDWAKIILKNPAGKKLTFELKKAHDQWRINRLPYVGPFYMRLLDVKIIVPVCVVLLIIGLLMRRAAIRAAAEAEG